jgi:hypothetical protein
MRVQPGTILAALVDLLLFFVIILLPLFHRRQGPALAEAFEPLAVVLITGGCALALVHKLVLDAGSLSLLLVFVPAVAVAAWLWSLVLVRGTAVYYSTVMVVGLGVPIVRFFLEELFLIEAGWLNVLSPVTAWPLVVTQADGAVAAWLLFGALLVSGVAALTIARGRART